MLWSAKEITAENRIIDHRKQRKEEKARLNTNKESISGRRGQKLLSPPFHLEEA